MNFIVICELISRQRYAFTQGMKNKRFALGLVIAWMLCAVSLVRAQVEVIYFLSPTCKICQFYSLEMRALYQEYQAQGVHFSAFAPGRFVTDSALTAYQHDYQLPFPVVKDDLLHRQLNATVTPEVFVLFQDQLVYYGRIDDSFVRVGKRRTHVKNHELRDALEALLHEKPLQIHNAPAVGCIIEK